MPFPVLSLLSQSCFKGNSTVCTLLIFHFKLNRWNKLCHFQFCWLLVNLEILEMYKYYISSLILAILRGLWNHYTGFACFCAKASATSIVLPTAVLWAVCTTEHSSYWKCHKRLPPSLHRAWFPWSSASWPVADAGTTVTLLWLRRESYLSQWPDRQHMLSCRRWRWWFCTFVRGCSSLYNIVSKGKADL